MREPFFFFVSFYGFFTLPNGRIIQEGVTYEIREKQWYRILSFHVSGTFKFWNNSGRWAFVSFVLLVISRFFLGLGLLGAMPCTWAVAFLRAVFVACFIPFFWRSFSMSTISRGSSIPRKSCFKSSSTFISGTLGSFGYAMSSWESRFDSNQIWHEDFRACMQTYYSEDNISHATSALRVDLLVTQVIKSPAFSWMVETF